MHASDVLTVVLVGTALMGTGCGRGLDDAKVAGGGPGATPTGRGPNAEQRAAMDASRELTKSGSAGSAIATLIEDLGAGAGPALLPVYDRRIPDRIGVGNVLGALHSAASMTSGTRPAVIRSRKTRAGQLVVARLLRSEGQDSTYSFLLRREDGRWTIVYDSLLAQALQAYVVGRKSNDPSKPSREAIRAGDRAVSELRLATVGPVVRKIPARRRPASSAKAPPAPSSTETPGAGASSSGVTATSPRE